MAELRALRFFGDEVLVTTARAGRRGLEPGDNGTVAVTPDVRDALTLP